MSLSTDPVGETAGEMGGGVVGGAIGGEDGGAGGTAGAVVEGTVGEMAGGAVGDAIGPAAGGVGGTPGSAFGGAVGETVGDVIGAAAGETVSEAAGGTAGAAVGETFGETVRDMVGDTIGETAREAVGKTTSKTVGETVGKTDRETVGRTVGKTTDKTVGAGRAEPLGTVLAIDGGNSKTDVVLVDEKGTVLASARTGGFTPQASGVDAAVAVAAEAVRRVRASLGVPDGAPLARHLSAYVAGADLEIEEEALALAFAAEGWTETVEVGNDTFALLRAGATRPWGVAVVCGAGVNACGIGPDGRRARFPALGRLTGDWGGGHYLGEEALWYAVRAEDGRGPTTKLAEAVAGHFGRETVEQVSIAIHLGEIDNERLNELSPVLMRVAAEGDAVALGLVDQMAQEVVTMARVALARLGIERTDAEVVLGGGVLRAQPPVLMERIAAHAEAEIPRASLVVAADPPVVGAALLGLDALGLTPG